VDVARIEWRNVSGERLRLRPPRGPAFELAAGQMMQIASADVVRLWWLTSWLGLQVHAGLLERREVDPQ
jgi:hypothetical protein